MRKKLTGVAAIILDEAGRLLVNKRTGKCKWEPGVWSLPCGKVEEGESPEKAIIRELEEEFGINVIIARKISERTYFLESMNADWTVYGYLCEIKSGSVSIREPEKTEEVRFVSPGQLPEKFFPELKTVVTDFQNQGCENDRS